MAKPGITAPACIMLEVSVGKLPHTIDLVMKNTFCVLPVIENNSKATEINQYLDFFLHFCHTIQLLFLAFVVYFPIL